MSTCVEDAALPRARLRAYWQQKAGNAPEEYEDAYATDGGLRRLALADGASDSYDSGRWARLLTTAFADVAPPAHAEGLGRWVEEVAGHWRAALDPDRLPWNQQAKARLGAHCTFLGVELDLAEQADGARGAPWGRWRAVAVGDACLFQVRDGALRLAFPLTCWEDFHQSPPLLTTNPVYRGPGLERLALASGDLRVGDRLLLATDALARWLLWSAAQREHSWPCLPREPEAFAAWIAALRQTGQLRNDDVTLLCWSLQDSAGSAAPAPVSALTPTAAGAASVPTVGTPEQPAPAGSAALVPKAASDRWLGLEPRA